MTTALQAAGAAAEPTAFAPLHTNRIFTGLYTNRSALRDGSTSNAQERAGYARQDSIWDGDNTEISTRLTLIRRPGNNVYNSARFSPVKRFYSFNTFTLTTEAIRVLGDTATNVIDMTGPNTNINIWTKSPGAGSTYFSSIGNLLYFTNGVDNRIYDNTTGQSYPWGVGAPPNAPTVSQEPMTNPYPAWRAGAGFGGFWRGLIPIWDENSNCFFHCSTEGTTGDAIPAFNPAIGSSTPDGSTAWTNDGFGIWAAGSPYHFQNTVLEPLAGGSGLIYMMFTIQREGVSGASAPPWTSGLGSLVIDGGCTWQNIGLMKTWNDYGPNKNLYPGTSFTGDTYQILDPNGYVQSVAQAGITTGTAPTFNTSVGETTIDGSLIWINTEAFGVAATAPRQYGYAFKNDATGDIGNMSPASLPITVNANNQVTVQGDGPTVPSDTTIIIYRTAAGGSTFLQLTTLPGNVGVPWTFVDTLPDSALNVSIQAQINGEATPLPAGATCIEYHLGRLIVAVGNVVYVATGPDAIASTSGGQAGFNTTFTLQSKIIRFWVTSLGLVIFTVRDSYIMLGSATTNDPLYVIKFIARLPLLSYDCMTEQNTTAFLFLGTRMIVALDPSSGIVEASFQISNVVQKYDPTSAYLTYHSEASNENALYLSDGVSQWNRMSPTSAPETGTNWSPTANAVTGFSATQSVEVTPGVFRLLLGPWAGEGTGPVRFRDLTTNQDDGHPYPAWATFGSIVMATPGQLAGIAFITLDSEAIGTPAALSVLFNETRPTAAAPFEALRRTRQDPPLLPPSNTLYSDRFSLLQKQNPVWCRHFQMRVDWPAENAANELIGFTIFGQLWQEYRSQ